MKSVTESSLLKWLFTLLFSGALLFVGLYFLFPLFIQWKISHLLEEEWESQVHYDHLYLRFGHLEVENLTLKGKSPYANYTLFSHSVKIGFQIDWWPWRLALNGKADAPVIEMHPKSSPLIATTGSSATNSTPDWLDWQATITEGQLIIHDSSAPKTFQQSFSLDCKEKSCRLVIWKGDHRLSLHFAKEMGALEEVELEKIELPSWTPLIHWLQPVSRNFSIESGLCSGQIIRTAENTFFGEFLCENLEGELQKTSYQIPLAKMLFSGGELQLTLEKPGQLSHTKGSFPYWSVRNLAGGLVLKKELLVDWGFHGQFFFNEVPARSLTFSGSLPLDLHAGATTHIDLVLNGEWPTEAHLELKPDREQLLNAHLQVSHLGSEEYQLLAQLLPQWRSIWRQADLTHGLLSFQLNTTILADGQLGPRFSIQELSGENLAFTLPLLRIQGEIGSIKARVDGLFRDEEFLPQEGEFTLLHGDLHWRRPISRQVTQLEHLENVSLAITFRDGMLQSGYFEGGILDLHTRIDFFGPQMPTIATLQVKGAMTGLAGLLPPFLLEVFGEHSVDWKASIEQRETQVFVKSHLNTETIQPLALDLDIEFERIPIAKLSENTLIGQLWGVSLSDAEGNYLLDLAWFKDQHGPFIIQLKQGTLESEHLLLEPLQGVLFPGFNGKLAGTSRMKGDFNSQSLLVHFEIENFLLRTNDFTLTAARLGHFPSQTRQLTAPASFFFYSFAEKIPRSFIPLKAGTYEDHTNKLRFENTSALIYIWKDHVRLSNIHTESEGLQFIGSIDVDLQAKDRADFLIQTQHAQGTVEQLQRFCHHFPKLQSIDLALKGKISSGVGGFWMRKTYLFDPEKTGPIDWRVEGMLSEGQWSALLEPFSLEGARATFSYASSTEKLSLQFLTGAIKSQEITFDIRRGDLLCDFAKEELCHFAIDLFHQEAPFTELSGQMQLTPEGNFSLSFAPNTRVGPLQLQVRELTFDAKELRSLQLGFKGDLADSWLLLQKLFPLPSLPEESLTGTLAGTIGKKGALYQFQVAAPALLLHAEGAGSHWQIEQLHLGANRLQGAVILLEKTAELQGSAFLQTEDWQGTLRGDLVAKWQEWPTLLLQGELDLRELDFHGKSLEVTEPLQISGLFNEGIRKITLSESDRWQLEIDGFDPATELPSSLHFTVKPVAIDALVKTVEQFFDLSPKLLTQIRPQDPIEGSWTGAEERWSATLSAGHYALFDQTLLLEKISFQKEGAQFSWQTQFRWERMPLLLSGGYDSEKRSMAVQLATTTRTQGVQFLFGLRHDAFQLESVQGQFAGLACQLQQDPYTPSQLQGSITLLEGKALAPLLPQGFADWIERWQINSGISWNGTIRFDSGLQFRGQLTGQQFPLLGHTWSNFTALVSYDQMGLVLQQSLLHEGSFELSMPLLRLFPTWQSSWALEIPSLTLSNFQPSLFYKTPATLKPFVVTKASLENLSGILGEKRSWKGSGMVRFEKQSKQNFIGALFTIPAQIFGRLGLNPNALSPAMGRLYFQLREGMILLTDLDGAYSEGKHSRFYLAKAPPQSTISFDGNLDIYLRMRQYNLLLKFFESLGIHITGSWDAPNVSVKKF